MGSFSGRMRHWGRLAVANPIAFAATFTLGAVLAFTYSYVPLHTVKDGKVARLESNVLQQEDQIAQLQAQIQGLSEAAGSDLDETAIADLEAARDKAKRDADSARKELASAKKKSRAIERERNNWKSKVAKLEKQIAETPTTHVVELRSDPTPAANADPDRALAGSAPPLEAGGAFVRGVPPSDPNPVAPAAPAP